MKNISVYVKGDRNSTAYYRIYQYFDKIQRLNFSYHVMYPLWVQNNCMPVSKQSFPMQVIIYIVAFYKVFFDLFRDAFVEPPEVIVVHKRLISRYMPSIFRYLLNKCQSNGSKIIWDFDDHLVEGKEMNKKTFEYFAKVSDNIVVTHEYLKLLLPKVYHDKVSILPTTDGDMYEIYENSDLITERSKIWKEELRLVWVATSANIKNIMPVIPFIDEAAKKLKKKEIKVILKVICDKPVMKETTSLVIENIKWTRESAIKGMRDSHIGIMPLLDIEYNKGKGGFKLVQYISIGLPCIGSNIGFNSHVISEECGILTSCNGDWTDAICKLSDFETWKLYSENAYKHWQRLFSFEYNLRFWKDLLQ